MGREVRIVLLNWEHPKKSDGSIDEHPKMDNTDLYIYEKLDKNKEMLVSNVYPNIKKQWRLALALFIPNVLIMAGVIFDSKLILHIAALISLGVIVHILLDISRRLWA